ncbi:MAG: hypothetical protein RL139_545, partial [Gemmatimonadota bacterium]
MLRTTLRQATLLLLGTATLASAQGGRAAAPQPAAGPAAAAAPAARRLRSAPGGDAPVTTGLVRGNAPGEWRYWGGDAWSSRYSPLDQITARNFDSLTVAWQWNAGT